MDQFWGNIFRRTEHDEVHALLRGVPMFMRLSKTELAQVRAILYHREYAPGELIFRQGAPGVGMYVVQRGTVEITYEPTGHRLAELGPGDFFGEIALLNETPRSATARAGQATTLWGLFQQELLDLIEAHPRLGVKLLLSLARVTGERLIRSDEQVLALHEQLHGRGPNDAPAPSEPAAPPTEAVPEADPLPHSPRPAPDADAHPTQPALG